MEKVDLGDAYCIGVQSLRDLIELVDREIAIWESQSTPFFTGGLGHQGRPGPMSTPHGDRSSSETDFLQVEGN